MKVGIGAALTPLILTYNEAPNIGRTLESLQWAARVIVLDSGSTDQTEAISKSFSNVDWQVRTFDNHRAQWEYGIRATGITSLYVLALDADMSVPENFIKELEESFLTGNYVGATIPFEYHISGRPLWGSVYPTQLRIFKPEAVVVTQSGHTQEFSINGDVYSCQSRLIHDDRKSVERWTNSQLAYSKLELHRASGNNNRLRDRLRQWGVMPLIVGILAYLRAGGPFNGAAAARYAYERTAYECLLGIRLMNAKLETDAPPEKSNLTKEELKTP